MRLHLLPTAAGGGGATDHGALTGLTDDDHTQYLLASGLRDWDELGAAPSTPAAGKWKVYPKATGLFLLEDDGTEERLALASEIPTVPDEFTDLTDTPANFTGAALDLVRVNAGATALEYVDLASIDHGALGGLTDDDHTLYLLASGLREWDEQGVDPSTPAAGKWALYFKSDGLHYIDDAGATTGPLGTGGGSAAWVSSGGEFAPDTGVIAAGDLMLHRARVADGASAVAHKFTNAVGLVTSGAKVFEFYRDDGTTVSLSMREDGLLQVETADGNEARIASPGDLSGGGSELRLDSTTWKIGSWNNAGFRYGWLNAKSAALMTGDLNGTVVSLGCPEGAKLSVDCTRASNFGDAIGDSYFSKSAVTGGNFTEFYDGTEVRRDDGTVRRYLAARGLGLYTAIGDTHPVVELDADGIHWGPGGAGAVDFALIRSAAGELILSGLPSTDPGVTGALWNDTGTLKIST